MNSELNLIRNAEFGIKLTRNYFDLENVIYNIFGFGQEMQKNVSDNRADIESAPAGFRLYMQICGA